MPEQTRDTAAFADLWCADKDWVRAEFDAIVAANFPPPSVRRPAPRHGSPDPAGPSRRMPRDPSGLSLVSFRPLGVRSVWARSPPEKRDQTCSVVVASP